MQLNTIPPYSMRPNQATGIDTFSVKELSFSRQGEKDDRTKLSIPGIEKNSILTNISLHKNKLFINRIKRLNELIDIDY